MVQVTNAPEGRTYIDYRWDIRPGAEQYLKVDAHPYAPPPFGYYTYRDEDVTEVQTPHIVPNGKWVMERPAGWAWLISTTFEELDKLKYTDKHDSRRILYISDKPFGFITADDEDVDMTVYPRVIKPNGRRRLVCAQQVHKGELGRSVSTPHVDYVRQPFEDGQKQNVTKAHQRRRGYGWVKLSHLGEMGALSYNPDKWVELVLGYWQYSGHLHYENYHRVGTFVDTVWGSSLDIQLGDIEVVSMTPEQFLREATHDPSELWVRRGFAYTVLRLLALGVRPEVAQLV